MGEGKKRKVHTTEFKAKVDLEARQRGIRGTSTNGMSGAELGRCARPRPAESSNWRMTLSSGQEEVLRGSAD
jgi:hypothetical protein